MFRTAVRAFTALTAAAALALAPSMAQAAPTSEAAPIRVAQAAPPFFAQPRLVDVRFSSHRGFDRLVFDFRGGVPDDFEARYVRRVFADPSGRRVFLPGRAFLLLRFEPARARSFERGLQRIDLDNVRAYQLVGDFEGVVNVALGLRHRADFRIFELRNRVVIDVENDE